MAWFVTFIIVGGIALVYFAREKNSQSNREARAANDALTRVGTAWDRAPADKRNRIISEAGINSISVQNALIVQPWAQLGIQLQTDIALRSSLLQQFAGGNSTDDMSTQNQTKEIAKETDNTGYFDAFFALAMRLSKGLSLSEWKIGIPQGYTHEESECIEATRQARSKLLYTTASRFVEEPLQRLLCEIGLLNRAREDRTNSYDECGTDLPPENLESISSTFLKAWLCNSNPFLLLELADFLGVNGRVNEAREVMEVALKFPAYAKTMTISDMELAAQLIAYELFPPGPSRDARSLGRGLYSPETVDLFEEECESVQRKLDELETEGSIAEDEFEREELPSDGSLPTLTVPDQDRMKKMWEAWKKDGADGIAKTWEKEDSL